MKKLIFIFIIYAIPLPTLSQIQKQWSIIHFPYGNTLNFAYLQKDQLMLNSIGDVIGGWRYNIAGSGLAVGTTSYDMSGNLKWEDGYINTNCTFISIAGDSLDNVYSLGAINLTYSTEDNIILKYDLNGNNIWTSENDSINNRGISAALCNGNICVLSRNLPSMYRYDNLTRTLIDTVKIDSTSTNGITDMGLIKSDGKNIYYGGFYFTTSVPFTGNIYASKTANGDSVLWRTVLDFTSGNDLTTNITFDKDENLFLLANLDASTLTRYVGVCAFDGTTGDTLWTQTIKSTTVESYPSEIVCDNAGHVYVTADIGIDSLQRFQMQLSQFNSTTGQLNWSLNFDSLFQEGNRYSKICVDTATKDIFVAYTLRPSTSYIRTAIMRIDSTGTILWKSVFDTLGSLEAFIYDQQNSLYMAGGVLTKFSLITNVDEQAYFADGEMNVHYNPESNITFISAKSLKGQNYKLFINDASGRIVYTEDGTTSSSFEKSLLFSRRNDGLYLVVLETEMERLIGKVVVY